MERWPVASLILKCGGVATLQTRDALGFTPLHYAFKYLCPDVQASSGPAAFNSAAAAWIEAASTADRKLRASVESEFGTLSGGYCDALERFRGSRGAVSTRIDGAVMYRKSGSVRADCFCPAGSKGYYEIELQSEVENSRWGFCTHKWGRIDFDAKDGAGDDEMSWGVDGDHVLKWHNGNQEPFGRRWRKGDVVGLACELPPTSSDIGGKILVSVNGDFSSPNGTAFDLPTGLVGLLPAVTCCKGIVFCNLGGDPARPLRYGLPAPDYQPMASFPPPSIKLTEKLPPPLKSTVVSEKPSECKSHGKTIEV
jgi:hypothetical protein